MGEVPTINVHDFCSELDLDLILKLYQLKIVIPGGIEINGQYTGIPDPGDVTRKLIDQANTALAPLTPLFDIIDVFLVLVEMFEAVASLSPPKIGKVLVKLKVKIDKLKKLIPQISIPIFITSVIDVIIVLLQALRDDVQRIIDQHSSLDLSRQRAVTFGSASLAASLDCAQFNLDAQLKIVQNNAQPLNRFLAILGLLCSLAGLPDIPTLDDLGEQASEALEPIDTLIKALKTFRDAIPL